SVGVRSAARAPPVHAPVGDAPLAFTRRRPGIIRRVPPPVALASLALSPLTVQECPAPRATALLGEQRLERRHGVDLAPA
ncbi:MAG: hypothetical protein OEV61_05175, partial [Chloroflexota bacterium]|nr:hypothetical protein [Chloroflexota bacterium]